MREPRERRVKPPDTPPDAPEEKKLQRTVDGDELDLEGAEIDETTNESGDPLSSSEG